MDTTHASWNIIDTGNIPYIRDFFDNHTIDTEEFRDLVRIIINEELDKRKDDLNFKFIS